MISRLRSIRFKLSVQYSLMVFGLGGALLGIVYLAIRNNLRSQTMTQYVIAGEPVYVGGELIGQVPTLEERELRTLESLFNEHVLNELARFMGLSLIVLFLLAIVVGWAMAGRFLKPIEGMTQVAMDIQASDLSRRIEVDGPDDEIGRLGATFNSMLDRLDQAFTSQRRFLADTSHDLRTPLTVIRSNVEVVTGDSEASVEEWREVGEIVGRNAEKMSNMIDELLAAARLQTGRAQAVTLDLAPLVQAKTDEYEPIASSAGVTLAARPQPAVVEGVEVAIDRALSNLLDNAVGVSGSGETVKVGSGVEDGWAWLAVSDMGPGLPEEPESGRIGLGLSIVEQIAGAHGGALAAYPNEGDRGTTMVVWLPAGGALPHPSRSPFTGP